MDLKARILRIADCENIDECLLDLDEVDFFTMVHENHGSYEINIGYENGSVNYISVSCNNDSGEGSDCPHKDDDLALPCSFIYSRLPIREMEFQRLVREGKKEDWDFCPIDYVLRALKEQKD